MSRNILTALQIVSFALIGLLLFRTFSKKEKIVYINTNKLLMEYNGMKQVQKELEKAQGGWRANIDTLQSELEQEIKKFEKDRSKLSKREAELATQVLRNKQERFMMYQETLKKKSTEEEQKKKGQIAEEMNSFLKEYGEAHGYQYILGATSLGNIVYANEVNDITADVIKIMNERYKAH